LQTIVHFSASDSGVPLLNTLVWGEPLNSRLKFIWPQDTRNITLSYGTSVTDGQINRRTERSLRLVDTNSVKAMKQRTNLIQLTDDLVFLTVELSYL